MGPTVTRPVQDPLAVLLLDNQLYIPYDKNLETHLRSHLMGFEIIVLLDLIRNQFYVINQAKNFLE